MILNYLLLISFYFCIASKISMPFVTIYRPSGMAFSYLGNKDNKKKYMNLLILILISVAHMDTLPIFIEILPMILWVLLKYPPQ